MAEMGETIVEEGENQAGDEGRRPVAGQVKHQTVHGPGAQNEGDQEEDVVGADQAPRQKHERRGQQGQAGDVIRVQEGPLVGIEIIAVEELPESVAGLLHLPIDDPDGIGRVPDIRRDGGAHMEDERISHGHGQKDEKPQNGQFHFPGGVGFLFAADHGIPSAAMIRIAAPEVNGGRGPRP